MTACLKDSCSNYSKWTISCRIGDAVLRYYNYWRSIFTSSLLKGKSSLFVIELILLFIVNYMFILLACHVIHFCMYRAKFIPIKLCKCLECFKSNEIKTCWLHLFVSKEYHLISFLSPVIFLLQSKRAKTCASLMTWLDFSWFKIKINTCL